MLFAPLRIPREVSMDSAHPRLQFSVAYPDKLSRLLIFVKWLLALPHFLALTFVALAVGIVTIIAFFAILFTGKYPESLWRFSLGFVKWNARVNAYAGLMRDEYPPFSLEADYPARLELAHPTRFSRLLVLIKWLLIIPHSLVIYFVGLAASLAMLVAWFAILFTGKYPLGLFRFYEGFLRWNERISAYTLLLTDDYPPFSLDHQPLDHDLPQTYKQQF
jgi:hypothetical protein